MTRLKKNSLLDNLLNRKRVTQNEFQWLTGMLSLCARVLPSGVHSLDDYMYRLKRYKISPFNKMNEKRFTNLECIFEQL